MAINTATGTNGVAGNVNADQQTYFAKTLLKQANYKTKLDQFATLKTDSGQLKQDHPV
jgi:hypothetical protein